MRPNPLPALALAFALSSCDSGNNPIHIINPLADPVSGPAAGYSNGHCAVPADAGPGSVASPDHVIGNGTASGCTAQAFIDAVAQGGTIAFSCGPDPITITLGKPAKVFNDAKPDIVIDGGSWYALPGISMHDDTKRSVTLITPNPPRMYPGQMLEYSVRPFPGFRSGWLTEITHVREGEYFVDEQRIGPYRLWHHEHHFRRAPGGVEMEDIVHYALPFGPFGTPIGGASVRRNLDRIFSFRAQTLSRRLGAI